MKKDIISKTRIEKHVGKAYHAIAKLDWFNSKNDAGILFVVKMKTLETYRLLNCSNGPGWSSKWLTIKLEEEKVNVMTKYAHDYISSRITEKEYKKALGFAPSKRLRDSRNKGRKSARKALLDMMKVK